MACMCIFYPYFDIHVMLINILLLIMSLHDVESDVYEIFYI